jgi:NitT/TauT family transport system ATP-binding protein
MSLVLFKKVAKAFQSREGKNYVAVRKFDLEIEPHELFCLLGPTGCGKTTVLNMLAGFELPTRGEIWIDGQEIRTPSKDRAVIFQGDDSLYPWLTALENTEFGLRMQGVRKKRRRERAGYYLDLVGLSGQENKHPQELSGGMKQRIQIARVLANEPKMLLMDEPFAALDAQTRAVMQEELRRIWQETQTCVLFITHDINEAIMLGTRIGVMKAGPASNLKGIVKIELDERRERTSNGFLKYYKIIYEMIREEVDKTLSRDK